MIIILLLVLLHIYYACNNKNNNNNNNNNKYVRCYTKHKREIKKKQNEKKTKIERIYILMKNI